MVVKRLFWDNPYETKCSAKIISIENKSNNIKLDQSIFYAFSGGQVSDLGTIGDLNVVNARITSNYDIEYELEGKITFKVGDTVLVKINWEKRYELMKLHSAQHIVADFFERETNISETLGGNIRFTKATLTYPFKESINEILLIIEKKINDYIKEDYQIYCEYDKNDQTRRSWKCNGFKCACGGTHVKSLLEIGEIKLKRKNAGKGKEGIEISLV